MYRSKCLFQLSYTNMQHVMGQIFSGIWNQRKFPETFYLFIRRSGRHRSLLEYFLIQRKMSSWSTSGGNRTYRPTLPIVRWRLIPSPDGCHWRLPENGRFKINVDVAWTEDITGIGNLIHNHQGKTWFPSPMF